MILMVIFASIIIFLPIIIVTYLFVKSKNISSNRGRIGIVPAIKAYMFQLIVLYLLSFTINLFIIASGQWTHVFDYVVVIRIISCVERFLLFPLGLGATLYFIYGIISSQEVTTND
jgi:hypothetical protein